MAAMGSVGKVKIPRAGLCRMAFDGLAFRSYWSGIREFEQKYHDYLQMLSFFRNGPVERVKVFSKLSLCKSSG